MQSLHKALNVANALKVAFYTASAVFILILIYVYVLFFKIHFNFNSTFDLYIADVCYCPSAV